MDDGLMVLSFLVVLLVWMLANRGCILLLKFVSYDVSGKPVRSVQGE